MTQVNTMNLVAAINGGNVRFFRDPIALATDLAAMVGPQFMAFDAVYDGDEKMVQKDRVTKLPNPYFGKGLKKHSTTQVTVNFNYEAKVEKRDGEYAGTGSWHQAILVNGKPSPLSTHKDDITIAPDGTQTFVDNPRLYLRYEIVRVGEGEVRAEKTMRSESKYLLPDGSEVAKELVEPYLKAKSERKDETDFQVTALKNIVELRAGGMIFRSAMPVGQ
jgi:hypothetical protein